MVITPAPCILSQVLKVDGAYVAVKFPGTSSSMSNQSSAAPPDSDPSLLLQDCRLLRIDELQVKIWRFKVSLQFRDSPDIFTVVQYFTILTILITNFTGSKSWWNSKSSRLFSAHTQKTVYPRKSWDFGCERWLQRSEVILEQVI